MRVEWLFGVCDDSVCADCVLLCVCAEETVRSDTTLSLSSSTTADASSPTLSLCLDDVGDAVVGLSLLVLLDELCVDVDRDVSLVATSLNVSSATGASVGGLDTLGVRDSRGGV